MTDLFDDGELGGLARRIDEWLAAFRDTSGGAVISIDRAAPGDVVGDQPRWYVRLRGEEKDYTTVWLTLGQRTLRYETYVMPAPEENVSALHESLLRRNERLAGARFSIGAEDAIYLRGEQTNSALCAAELDRIVGSLFAYVEQCFRPLMRIGFASRFRR